MTKSTLSASAAAKYVGFSSINPILDAIANGELAAERRPGPTRPGVRDTRPYMVKTTMLEAWAARRGLDLPNANGNATPEPEPAIAEPEPESTIESNVANPYEMIRELHIPFKSARKQLAEPPSPAFMAGVLGVVTIPVEHYATLVGARAELEFIRANFELTWRGISKKPLSRVRRKDVGVPGEIHTELATSATPPPARKRRNSRKIA